VAVVQAIIEQVNVRIRETDELIQRNIEALEDDPPDTKSASTTKAPEPRVTIPAPFHGRVDLRKMSALKKLSPADLEILSAAAPAKHYPGKSIICVEGAKAACCYLLISGRIDVLRKAQNKYRRLATLGPGALVGQLALVDTAPRTATLQAQTEVVVLEFARDDFKRLLDAESPLAIRFQEEVAVAGIRQLRKATAALASLPGHVRPAPVNTEGSVRSEAQEKESEADSEMKETLTFMQTALREWGMNLKDLDQIRVVKPPGQMSAAEIKARAKR
jgi:CRP-like cAMP-binding protein